MNAEIKFEQNWQISIMVFVFCGFPFRFILIDNQDGTG
jgi:hypothetical protein